MQINFSLVRSSLICSLCGGRKSAGIVCCWDCYREKHIRDGNKEAEALITAAEAKLKW